jgi:hypothetical protein
VSSIAVKLGLGLAFLVASACASGGPYGYARTYVPTSDEEDAAEGASEYDPVMAQRVEDEWIGKKVSIFGVVNSISSLPDGAEDVLLSVRGLQPRNLCLSHDEETCRVTVTDHEFAKLHATIVLKEDLAKVGPGSLLRVIGKISEKPHPKTGNRVIIAELYRQWPANEFVTLSEREFLRQ